MSSSLAFIRQAQTPVSVEAGPGVRRYASPCWMLIQSTVRPLGRIPGPAILTAEWKSIVHSFRVHIPVASKHLPRIAISSWVNNLAFFMWFEPNGFATHRRSMFPRNNADTQLISTWCLSHYFEHSHVTLKRHFGCRLPLYSFANKPGIQLRSRKKENFRQPMP